jgi:DNA-binding NarL/FixJ family response regulator
MIKVFIIDDHQIVIDGIYFELEKEKDIEWMGSAKLPSSLMAVLKHRQPDVLLMDIHLPERSGLDLCREIKELYPGIHIIGLSTSDQASMIRKLLDNGASGYLLKDASKTELLTALHEVVQGKIYMNFSVAHILKNNMPDASTPLLTKREKEVMELIAEGLTNHEIAERLFVNCSTIDSHRKNMLTKFNVKNTAALVKFAVKHNLI